MSVMNRFHLPSDETLDRAGIERLQRAKLAALLAAVCKSNLFYQNKLDGIAFDAERDPLERLPFTTRDELQRDQRGHPLYGSNLTFPLRDYIRMHATSGSMGRPMFWLDTAESWAWCRKGWRIVFVGACLEPGDRIFFPFSFGPFIGFWMAFEAGQELGNFCLSGGGMSTQDRLRMIVEHEITVICCTPTYALRLAEAAAEEGVDLAGSKVRLLIVAGEPGGHIPAVRERIERAWGARVSDHAGMTETGPWGFECAEHAGGMHVIDTEFIAESIDPVTDAPVGEGAAGELVITTLGRTGSPLIRYRTGDRVTLTRGRCACGRWFSRAEGGIVGRVDDMLHIRGNNVFPSAVEAVLRRFDEVGEFRLSVVTSGGMNELKVELETGPGAREANLLQRVELAMQRDLHFRPLLEIVETGSLPRFEMKARRVVR